MKQVPSVYEPLWHESVQLNLSDSPIWAEWHFRSSVLRIYTPCQQPPVTVQILLGSKVIRTHATEDLNTSPSSCWCSDHRY